MAGAAVAGLSRDERACAWCGEQRAPLVWGGWVCAYGCADAEHAPYRGHCEDCRAEYWTGNPKLMHQCERCAGREHDQIAAEYAEPGQAHTGYMYRMRRDGANRRALAIKLAAEQK